MPPSLLLKLVVTPVLIAAATMAGRRWGHALSGWLVGLPLTSGPVVFFLALEQGRPFAAGTALGIILGVASQAVFAVTYVRAGRRTSWWPKLLAGTVAFAAITVVFRYLPMPAAAEPVVVIAFLVAGILLIPAPRPAEQPRFASPAGDLPLRIVVATGLVIGLTSIAPYLGSYLSGLITPFPLYAAILAVFAHRQAGEEAAVAVWRGLLFGLFSFLAFFTVLAATLISAGIGPSFILATIAALAVQAMTLGVMRGTRATPN